MSLLSSTQGTPERVWSLISVLAINEGTLTRAEASDWLNPRFTRDGAIVSETPTAFAQTLGAATSLGAVESDGAMLRLNPLCYPRHFVAFCDWIHDKLIGLDSGEKDAVVLETFAWLAVESNRRGSIGWVNDWTNDQFADTADQALPDASDNDGERRLNKDKLPSWRRWLISLGLMVPLPIPGKMQPLADARTAREIARANLPINEEIGADVFLAALAARLPYLDGGRMFVAAARRLSHAPTPRQLSPLLSGTLRNLHDEGMIELMPRGDSGDLLGLSQDKTHRIKSFQSVIVREIA
jgi:hypothetical protein